MRTLFILTAVMGLALSSCHTISTKPTTAPVAAVASPAQLGGGIFTFDFSQARVTETEEDVIQVANRSVQPNEFGFGNRRTVTSLSQSDGSLVLAKYSKTGSQSAHISIISIDSSMESVVKKDVLPRISTLSTDNIIQLIEYRTADMSTEYRITFTSPTSGTAEVQEAGGTFVNTIKNVMFTYVPDSAASAAAPASPAALSAPASLNGAWIRIDYSAVGVGGSAHDWFHMHNGSLFRLNTAHAADSVPANPGSLRQIEVHYEDEKGRAYSPTENFAYQSLGNSFSILFDIQTNRRTFSICGAYKADDSGFYKYLPRPIVVTLDKADAHSVSGHCTGYEGSADLGIAPQVITRMTIFR